MFWASVVALRSAAAALRRGGKTSVDYMNTERTLRELVREEKTVAGITCLYRGDGATVAFERRC